MIFIVYRTSPTMSLEERFQIRQRKGLYTLRQIGRDDLGYQMFADEILFHPDDECVETYLRCCDELDKYKFAEDARKTARKAAEDARKAAEAAKAPEFDYPPYDFEPSSDLE